MEHAAAGVESALAPGAIAHPPTTPSTSSRSASAGHPPSTKPPNRVI